MVDSVWTARHPFSILVRDSHVFPSFSQDPAVDDDGGDDDDDYYTGGILRFELVWGTCACIANGFAVTPASLFGSAAPVVPVYQDLAVPVT